MLLSYIFLCLAIGVMTCHLGSRDERPRRIALATAWLGASMVWGLQIVVTYDVFRYTTDSVVYVSEARAVQAGLGFVTTPSSGLEPDVWFPVGLFPAGYAMLIAATGNMSGMDASIAAHVVALASGLIAIGLIGWLAAFYVSGYQLFSLLVLVAVTPGFLRISTTPWSDAPFLALATCAIGCAIRAIRGSTPSARWLVASGLAAGLAWWTRNAGVALMAALGLFIVLQLVWFPVRAVARIAFFWGLGAAITAGSLVAYNVTTFGSILPYLDALPAEISLSAAFREAVVRLAIDLSGRSLIPGWIASRTPHGIELAFDPIFLWVIAGLGLIAGAVALAREIWRMEWKEILQIGAEHRLLILLSLYTLIYVAQVIVARATFLWGERLNSRHFAQIYFVVWLGVALVLNTVLGRLAVPVRWRHAAVSVVLLSLAAVQLHNHFSLLELSRQQGLSSKVAAIARTAQDHIMPALGVGQMLLACDGSSVRYFFGADVRGLPDQRRGETPLERESIQAAIDRGSLGGIMIDDLQAAKDGHYGADIASLLLEGGAAFGLVKIEQPNPEVALFLTRAARAGQGFDDGTLGNGWTANRFYGSSPRFLVGS